MKIQPRNADYKIKVIKSLEVVFIDLNKSMLVSFFFFENDLNIEHYKSFVQRIVKNSDITGCLCFNLIAVLT